MVKLSISLFYKAIKNALGFLLLIVENEPKAFLTMTPTGFEPVLPP